MDEAALIQVMKEIGYSKIVQISKHDYSGTKYPFDRNVIEESLNTLAQTEKDVLYLYLWECRLLTSMDIQTYG